METLIDRLTKSWKTSCAGLVTSVAAFIAFSPEFFVKWPILLALAKFIMAGGFAAIGLLSKDATAHSTLVEVEKATSSAEKPSN